MAANDAAFAPMPRIGSLTIWMSPNATAYRSPSSRAYPCRSVVIPAVASGANGMDSGAFSGPGVFELGGHPMVLRAGELQLCLGGCGEHRFNGS